MYVWGECAELERRLVELMILRATDPARMTTKEWENWWDLYWARYVLARSQP